MQFGGRAEWRDTHRLKQRVKVVPHLPPRGLDFEADERPTPVVHRPHRAPADMKATMGAMRARVCLRDELNRSLASLQRRSNRRVPLIVRVMRPQPVDPDLPIIERGCAEAVVAVPWDECPCWGVVGGHPLTP